MMPLEPVTLSVSAAVLLGLSFGAGPCNIACLPYLGPVFLASGNGVRDSWRTLLPFSLGRISGYSLLASLAGWVGLWVQDWIASPWVPWLLGGATILVAVSLLFRQQGCSSHRATSEVRVEIDTTNLRTGKRLMPGGLFLMGMGMALNPCAPLSTIILAAATSASVFTGFSLGFGFGLGAALIPGIVFAFGVAHLGAQIREHLSEWRGTLEKGSVGLLVLMGAGTALGWITP